MIADTLHQSKQHIVGGEVSVAGVGPAKDVYWSNVVTYIDQIDRIHPYMTVGEVCEFSFKCGSGGTHRKKFFGEGPEVEETLAEMDKQMMIVNTVLRALGLARVKDTFVGDQTTVRGVSGGEKKRVTMAEMLVTSRPVMCCDEISTGLDAATTFDITRTLSLVTQLTETIKIVSLLQPPPETVANFDDLILVHEGKVIYMGPVDEVVEYFNSLGYMIPDRMDVADWLQALPTNDGWQYLKEVDLDTPYKELASKHLSPDQFREKFHESKYGIAQLEQVEAPVGDDAAMIKDIASRKYQNSAFKSLKIVGSRELLLWRRDKYAIKMKVGDHILTFLCATYSARLAYSLHKIFFLKIAQNIIMSVVVGTLFYQQAGDSPQSVLGVLFQVSASEQMRLDELYEDMDLQERANNPYLCSTVL